MERRVILSGSVFEEEIGYARAVVVGDRVYVSGTTGFDYATMTISGDVVEVNEALAAEPALVNSDAAGKAWFFKVKIADKSELGGLMDEAAYKAHTA